MLLEFLSAMARRPFVWGETDCCLVLAEWWRINHGSDPAAHLRGTYSTEDECWSVIDEAGGVLRVVSDIATTVQAETTTDPQPGDFGVVSAMGLRFGSIMTPTRRWFVKGRNGAAGLREARALAAWKI
jgi:hypothetical protein